MARAEEYLIRAERAERSAAGLAPGASRRELLDVASQWRRLARRAAEAEDQARGRRPPEGRSFDVDG
jgi:hypothetical protein